MYLYHGGADSTIIKQAQPLYKPEAFLASRDWVQHNSRKKGNDRDRGKGSKTGHSSARQKVSNN